MPWSSRRPSSTSPSSAGSVSPAERRCDVARSTQAEVARRVGEIFPLVCDCMTLREVRAFADAKTDWGRAIYDAQLKRYMAKARQLMREAAAYDRDQEFGAARRRLERVIARAAAKGD